MKTYYQKNREKIAAKRRRKSAPNKHYGVSSKEARAEALKDITQAYDLNYAGREAEVMRSLAFDFQYISLSGLRI